MSLPRALRHIKAAIETEPDSENRRRLHQAATLVEKAHATSRPVRPHQVVEKYFGNKGGMR
jgi:hypothetical protein